MSEAIQDARRWLAKYDGMPLSAQQSGATHVRALLREMALMGRRPAEAGYDWLMTNVDMLLSEAAVAGNEHRHHEEDISLRVASVRSNQAVAAALRDRAATKPSEWDTMTAKEADAFQSVAIAVLNSSPGAVRSMPGYPDAAAHEIIEACHLEGIDPVGVELICSALMDVGPWEEIDGDGTNTSIIIDHIRRLAALVKDSATLTELQVQRAGFALDQARKLVLVILSQMPVGTDGYRVLDQANILIAHAVHTLDSGQPVTVFAKPQVDEPTTSTT